MFKEHVKPLKISMNQERIKLQILVSKLCYLFKNVLALLIPNYGNYKTNLTNFSH